MAMILMITATVKAMDSQRWVCRINLLKFNETSSQEMGSGEDEGEADRAHEQVRPN
jgi:hypothetical protein